MNQPTQDLIEAVKDHTKAQAVRQGLAAGADPNACGADGYTVLQSAARHVNNDAVSLLLTHGADPNAVGLQKISAVQFSLMGVYRLGAYAKLKMFHALMDAGAALPTDPKALAEMGRGAVQADAVCSVDSRALKRLLSGGLDPNATQHLTGDSLLLDAAASNNASACLLLAGLGADVEAVNRYRTRPVQAAFYKQSQDALLVLLALGARHDDLMLTAPRTAKDRAIKEHLERPALECALLTKNPAVLALALERAPAVGVEELQALQQTARKKRITTLLPVVQAWMARAQARSALDDAHALASEGARP